VIRTIELDATKITDRETFHTVFAKTFGFVESYGCNGDAWIDCMSRLDEDFSEVTVAQGDLVLLHLANSASLKAVAPQILSELFETAAFVNWRRTEIGLPPKLILSCYT
jgi:RNAse (barnase) inhibitor barstar